jgi:hypothetical protein
LNEPELPDISIGPRVLQLENSPNLDALKERDDFNNFVDRCWTHETNVEGQDSSSLLTPP